MSNALTKTPPQQAPKSVQYDLFTRFFGDARDHSNTIELWDAIPKYAVGARRQNKLRDENGRLPLHEHEFEYRPSFGDDKQPVRCRLSVQPASIKTDTGQIDFYPSMDEELIEEVLKKIFTDQQYGLHTVQQGESWVRFTLYMIRKELNERGKTRSYQEILRSLEIMTRSVTEVEIIGKGKKLLYTNPIITDLTRITRSDYLDDPHSMWCARLPALVSKSINDLTYRQFNYLKHFDLSTQLGFWFHKRLSHNYVNADFLHPYTILYSSIKRDSGHLYDDQTTNRHLSVIGGVLDEFVEKSILLSHESERRMKGRKILDVLYKLIPHPEFIKDMKASNARVKEGQARVQAATKKTGR